jgi:tetratricopeptide (TPR) repeat protein
MSVAAAQPSKGGALEHGLRLFSEAQFSEAEQSLRGAVAEQPESFEARLALGATLAQLKRPAEAIEQLQVAHRLRPRHSDVLKLLAAQYMIERRYANAIALLLPVSARDEEIYLLLIESYQSSGDTPRSFAMAQEAVRRFPSSAQINCWMGFQLQFSGRYEDARGYLDNAIRLAPEYPATYYVLAEVLLKQQKARESLPYFEKAIEFDPDDIEARLGLSRAWAGVGDTKTALTVLQAAEKSAPEDARVHLLLSRLWFRLGDEPRAQEEAKLSLQYRKNETRAPSLPSAR